MPKLTKVCPECSVSVNRICSRLVVHLFGLSNALFLDMLVRFSSRLDMLLLGLSDALLHLIAILLLFLVASMEILRFSTKA